MSRAPRTAKPWNFTFASSSEIDPSGSPPCRLRSSTLGAEDNSFSISAAALAGILKSSARNMQAMARGKTRRNERFMTSGVSLLTKLHWAASV